MIYQQYITAIKRSYRDSDAVAELLMEAKRTRKWLASLELESQMLGPIVEPIAAIEEAFRDLSAEDRT
jgi:hypothetical protein